MNTEGKAVPMEELYDALVSLKNLCMYHPGCHRCPLRKPTDDCALEDAPISWKLTPPPPENYKPIAF